MTTVPISPPNRLHRRWRLLLAVCVLAVTGFTGIVGWQMLRVQRARAELQQVIAELDRDEPGWRIEDLEAARANVPDAENNVPVILRAQRALPRIANEEQDRFKALREALSPQVRLSNEQYQYCIDQLETMERAVWPIEQLAHMPRGYCPIHHVAGSGDLVLVNAAYSLQFWPTYLLVLVHAHEGDATAGLRMCVVNLHIAAAIGDEPFLVCQRNRSLHVNIALRGLERLLGHSEIPEPELEAFQTKLFAESVHDPWPVGLRGERAWKHQAFDAAARGILPYSELRRLVPNSLPAATWPDKARDWFADRLPTNLDVAHMRSLRRQTQLLRESGRVLWDERPAQVTAFEADDTAVEFIPLGIGFAQILRQLQTGQARLQCAIAGAAAERFRIRHGHWPESLAALVPDFLPAVAPDPFDGHPLRYRRLADGVVIYTVGPDLADNAGNLTRDFPAADGTDSGFRLWDVASRGQAPKNAGAP